MDTEPRSGAGWLAHRAGSAAEDHNTVTSFGTAMMPSARKKANKPCGEEHHLDGLRHHHHRHDVDLLGPDSGNTLRLVTRRDGQRRAREQLGRI